MAKHCRRDPELAWNYVDLDVITLLSFEGPCWLDSAACGLERASELVRTLKTP
jgi:hypothetical protein